MKPLHLRQSPDWVKQKPAGRTASIRRHFANKAMGLAHGAYIGMPGDGTVVPKKSASGLYEIREPQTFGHHIAVDPSISRLSKWEALDYQGKKIIWFDPHQGKWVIKDGGLVALENDELVQAATLEEILKHSGIGAQIIEDVGRNTPELLGQDHYVVTREGAKKVALYDEERPLDDIPEPRMQIKH